MNFYRYEIVEYATIGHDGDFVSSPIPNPSVVLREFNLYKETPKGYWIGYGSMDSDSLRSQARWVSKTSRKRYAYPTKEGALQGFISRTKRRESILERQAWSCRIALSSAENMLKELQNGITV
jgi:hypothetical protein